MSSSVVRIQNITINNYRNIKHASISLKGDNDRTSILGLYGQNGTGKTTFINAIKILKSALIGEKIEDTSENFPTTEYAEFEFEFSIEKDEEECFKVTYNFKLEAIINEEINGNLINNNKIFDEVLSYSYTDGLKKIKKNQIFNTNTDSKTVFLPTVKYDLLIGKNVDSIDMLVKKNMARQESKSFIFSNDLQEQIEKQKEKNESNEEFNRIYYLLKRLITYGHMELFVISTSNTGYSSINNLPLLFRKNFSKGNVVTYRSFLLPIDKMVDIPKAISEETKKIIKSINIVLKNIIPNLQIKINEYVNLDDENKSNTVKIQLYAQRGDEVFPLVDESEGIKKIISVLQLLIVIYNQPNITVAIDELDLGIFEYLLGELLNIIAFRGKGQLIFTSHNLRPLERLDKNSIAFTTSNPNNRIIRLKKARYNKSLRDFYFRSILLGGQDEELYDSADYQELAFSFDMAGEDLD